MSLFQWEFLLFIYIVFLSVAVMKGVTGLGFSTLSLPLLTIMMDIKSAIPLVIIPSVTSNLLVMISAGSFNEAVKKFWPLYLALIPGIITGLIILNNINSIYARSILGIVLVTYSIWAMKNDRFNLKEKYQNKLKVPTGLITGIVNGITGSQTMPLLPYMISMKMDRSLFVQAINISFTFSSIIMLTGLKKIGLLKSDHIIIAFVGILPIFLGIFAGNKIRKKINDEIFRKITLYFLVTAGSILVIRSLV